MEELNRGMVEPLRGKVGLFRELEEPLHGTARPTAPFAGRIRFPGRLKTAPERGEPVAFDPESSTEMRTGTAPTACATRSSRPRTASEMRFTKDRDDRDSRDSRDQKAGSACFFLSLESPVVPEIPVFSWQEYYQTALKIALRHGHPSRERGIFGDVPDPVDI